MALAGLHNVSALGPSFFVESQSPSSKLMDEGLDRPGSQTSCLLRMCSENHHESSSHVRNQTESSVDAVSEVDDETENQRLTIAAERSQEDNDSVVSEQSSDTGERERERMRQTFSQRMNSGAEVSSQDRFQENNNLGSQCVGEHVCNRARIIREWVQTNAQHRNNGESSRNDVSGPGSQVEQVRNRIINSHTELGGRRPVRRICGRQTLLDLLVRAQSERNRELQGLSEQRPVSDFAHRNRIQALLRGRFLRTDTSFLSRRQSSMAETELGLLGQRHTVSDLREGFLSNMHRSSSTSSKSDEPGSSSDDENNGEMESTFTERVPMVSYSTSDSGSAADVLQVEDSVEEPNLIIEIQEVSGNSESIVNRHSESNNATPANEPSLESVYVNSSGSMEVTREQDEPGGFSRVQAIADQTTDLERSTDEQLSRQDMSELGSEGNTWHHLTNVVRTDRMDSNIENLPRSWLETSDNQWEQDRHVVGQVHESRGNWSNHDLQEAIDSWLDMPSGEIISSIGGTDRLYFPDSDNTQSVELRELLSRRRVSGLLRSDFRESLDQVLQSHMERQGGRASENWEVDVESSSSSIEQDSEQLGGGVHALAPSLGEEEDTAHPLSLWDGHSDLYSGAEWESINDLRVDMARLQLRMNSMQTMLEACMELQIELQRSVRQEFSAALNHSVLSRASSSTLHSETQWDSVRKGICCLCCDTTIDSLLYRCGHMCTCSKCAEVLVQGSGKCPMCQAPVVEVVRAYFIQ